MSVQSEVFHGAQPAARFTKCRRCGRGLRSERAQRLGYGSLCARKMGVSLASAAEKGEGELDTPNAAPMQIDVRVWRDAAGNVQANVPRSVIWHSPTGFECGYGGSGPADLALCILNAFVPPGRELDYNNPNENFDRDDAPEKVYRGYCSQFAARNHQEFKRDFIERMARDGGTLHAGTIARWIAQRRQS